jgi:hypothetical protein
MKLDELLPSYDVAARYDISIQASPAETANAIENTDFSELRLTKLLLGLRTVKPKATLGPRRERKLNDCSGRASSNWPMSPDKKSCLE